MSISDQRVIYNGLDISTQVDDFRSKNALFGYETGQYLYIGSLLPFNNFWLDMQVANTIDSAVSIDIWWGNSWVSAVDIIDETSGFKFTGRVNFNTNRLSSWDLEQTSKDVVGLTTFEIYWKYWIRISFSANFSASSAIKYIGQKFSNDDILYSYYPDLAVSSTLDSFETGKTTWDEQHYMAADHIISDLKKRNIIKSKFQIMDYSLFTEASCHRIAEMVYIAFGSPYFDQLIEAKKSYKEAMNLKFFDVDLNKDGSLSPVERNFSSSFMRR